MKAMGTKPLYLHKISRRKFRRLLDFYDRIYLEPLQPIVAAKSHLSTQFGPRWLVEGIDRLQDKFLDEPTFALPLWKDVALAMLLPFAFPKLAVELINRRELAKTINLQEAFRPSTPHRSPNVPIFSHWEYLESSDLADIRRFFWELFQFFYSVAGDIRMMLSHLTGLGTHIMANGNQTGGLLLRFNDFFVKQFQWLESGVLVKTFAYAQHVIARLHVLLVSEGINYFQDFIKDRDKQLDEDALRLKDEGDKADKAKDWNKAVAMYTDAMEKEYLNDKLFLLRARSHLKLNNYVLALNDALRATFIRPESAEGYVVQLEACIGLKDLNQARDTLCMASILVNVEHCSESDLEDLQDLQTRLTSAPNFPKLLPRFPPLKNFLADKKASKHSPANGLNGLNGINGTLAKRTANHRSVNDLALRTRRDGFLSFDDPVVEGDSGFGDDLGMQLEEANGSNGNGSASRIGAVHELELLAQILGDSGSSLFYPQSKSAAAESLKPRKKRSPPRVKTLSKESDKSTLSWSSGSSGYSSFAGDDWQQQVDSEADAAERQNEADLAAEKLREDEWLYFQSLIVNGNNDLLKENWSHAVEVYQKAKDSIQSNKELEERISKLHLTQLDYCLAFCSISSAKKEAIESARKTVKELLESSTALDHALLHYAHGLSFLKEFRFVEAQEVFQKTLQLVQEAPHGKVYSYLPLVENNDMSSDQLKNSLTDLLHQCKYPPTPDAICRFGRCSAPKRNIYSKDPGFKDYTRISCDQRCVVTYHAGCWKQERRRLVEESADKEMLNCPTADCPGFITLIETVDMAGEVASKHETKRLKAFTEEKKGDRGKSSGSSTNASIPPRSSSPLKSKSPENPKPAPKPKREQQTELKGAEGGSSTASAGPKSEASPKLSVETGATASTIRQEEDMRLLYPIMPYFVLKEHSPTQSAEVSEWNGTTSHLIASLDQALDRPFSRYKKSKKPLSSQNGFKTHHRAFVDGGNSEKTFHASPPEPAPLSKTSDDPVVKEVERKSIFSSFEELIRRHGPLAVDSSELSKFLDQIPYEFLSLFAEGDTLDEGRFELVNGRWHLSDDYDEVDGVGTSGLREQTPTPITVPTPTPVPTPIVSQPRSMTPVQPEALTEVVATKTTWVLSEEVEELNDQTKQVLALLSQYNEERQRFGEELKKKNKEIDWLRSSVRQEMNRAEEERRKYHQFRISSLEHEMRVWTKLYQSELEESQRACRVCNELYSKFPGMGDNLRQCAALWNGHQFELQDRKRVIETQYRSRIDAMHTGEATGDETLPTEELPERPVSPLLLLLEWVKANPAWRNAVLPRSQNPDLPEMDKLDHIVLKIGLRYPDLSRKDIISYVKKLGASSIKLSELSIDQAVIYISDLIARSYKRDVSLTACAICLENLEPTGEIVMGLECGHRLHMQCLHPWMAKNGTCPSCRAPILLPSEFPKLA